MISCAHPEHFDHMFTHGKPWLERIRSIRADASRKGQAELDESDMLDEENTEELSKQYRALLNLLPNLTVVGGCYGTDHRHVAAIARAFREQ